MSDEQVQHEPTSTAPEPAGARGAVYEQASGSDAVAEADEKRSQSEGNSGRFSGERAREAGRKGGLARARRLEQAKGRAANENEERNLGIERLKELRNLTVALPEKELHHLWENANDAVGRLMAGMVGRREWDDDVMALFETVYDDLCSNGFDANLYNTFTVPLCFMPWGRSWTNTARRVWDPDRFREVADDFRVNLVDEGWKPPGK